MEIPRKRIWKRIIITVSDTSDSEDDAPACKHPRNVAYSEDRPRNEPRKSVRKRRHSELTGGVDIDCSDISDINSPDLFDTSSSDEFDIDSIGLQTRRSDQNSVLLVTNSEDTSSLYTRVSVNIPASVYASDTANQSELFPQQNKTESTVINNVIPAIHLKYLLHALFAYIDGVNQRNQFKVSTSSELEFLLKISERAMRVSSMAILNVMFLNPPECDIFVPALKSVVKFCQNQMMTLKSGYELVDNKVLSRKRFFKTGLTTLYSNLINLATVIVKLLTKKKLWMDEFLVLVMDIALLPTFQGAVAKLQDCCLYLIRCVLKSHDVCWQKCTDKLYSAMVQQSWSDAFSVPLESGKHANKFTLLFLTLIQSSVEFREKQVNAKDFVQSITSGGLDFILGQRPDNVEDLSADSQQAENACFVLGSVLDGADCILWYFYSKVEEVCLTEEDQIPENFGKLLQDFLVLLEEPQWPAADYALITFCEFAVDSLKEQPLPRPSCHFLLKCLGSVFMVVARLFSSRDRSVGSTAEASVQGSSDSSEKIYIDGEEAEPKENLRFLQTALLVYLVKQSRDNLFSHDGCLFYLAVWFTEKIQKEFSNETWVEWMQARDFVTPWNVKLVVKCIARLRRTPVMLNIFSKVLSLKSVKSISKYVMDVVFKLCQSNSKMFIETPVIRKMFSCRLDQDPIMLRKMIVECLTEFLLHRPQEMGLYRSVLNSYVSDKEAISVRDAAVKGMRKIGLRYYEDPKILTECVLLFKMHCFDSRSAAQTFCKITWLKPVQLGDEAVFLKKKVSMLVNMFSLIEDMTYVEERFPDLFRLDSEGPERIFQQQLEACEQIVGEIAQRCLDKKCSRDVKDYRKSIASFKLLHLFAKITPAPLVSRCIPAWRCFLHSCQMLSPDVDMISATAKSMEVIIPFIPTEEDLFLFHVEAMSAVVALRHNKRAIQTGLMNVCSIAVSRQNYETSNLHAGLSFSNLFICSSMERFIRRIQLLTIQERYTSRYLMALGVLLKNVGLNARGTKPTKNVLKKLVSEIVTHPLGTADENLEQFALFVLGSVCLRHFWLILLDDVARLYLDVLQSDVPAWIIQVLKNIFEFLRLLQEYSAKKIGQDRKPELTGLDGSSPVKSKVETVHDFAEAVCGRYLDAATKRYFHPDKIIRFAVLDLVLVVKQYNVEDSVEIIPLLAAMASDPEKQISERARKELISSAETRPHCIYRASANLLSFPFKLFKTVSEPFSLCRGYYIEKDGTPTLRSWVLNPAVLKSVSDDAILISGVLKKFWSNGDCIFDLLFYADNLVYFDYSKRKNVVEIVLRLEELIVSDMKAALERFEQVLRIGGEHYFSIHHKIAHDVLRIVLISEIKSFLAERYSLDDIELRKVKSNESYRIQLRHGGMTTFVSDRSKLIPIPRQASTMLFQPTLSIADVIEGNMHCCGREFSRETLEKFHRMLEQLKQLRD